MPFSSGFINFYFECFIFLLLISNLRICFLELFSVFSALSAASSSFFSSRAIASIDSSTFCYALYMTYPTPPQHPTTTIHVTAITSFIFFEIFSSSSFELIINFLLLNNIGINLAKFTQTYLTLNQVYSQYAPPFLLLLPTSK